jgi:hypothetical protein
VLEIAAWVWLDIDDPSADEKIEEAELREAMEIDADSIDEE